MDYSDFIVLLARQRSGTNALISVLRSHEDIFCLPPVFNFRQKDSPDPLERETNFFTFIHHYADGAVDRLSPANHTMLFLDYLEFLRCFSTKRYIVLDVKYNTTNFFTELWPENVGKPYFLKLAMTHGLKVLNITRKNYLRYILSHEKVAATGLHHAARSDDSYTDPSIRLDVEHVVAQLENCAAEDSLIETTLSSYPNLLGYDYADLFSDGCLSSEFVKNFSTWLGVPASFRTTPYFKKHSSLSLRETVLNFPEIDRALRGTPYEYCLEDESAYSREAAKPARATERRQIARMSSGRAARAEARR